MESDFKQWVKEYFNEVDFDITDLDYLKKSARWKSVSLMLLARRSFIINKLEQDLSSEEIEMRVAEMRVLKPILDIFLSPPVDNSTS